MESFSDYLEAAKKAIGDTTYSNIAYHLDMTRQHLHQCKKGERQLDEERMMKLARRAGFDQGAALLWLAYWRADGTAKTKYKNLLTGEKRPNWGFIDTQEYGVKPWLKKFGVIFAIGPALFSPFGGIDAQAAAKQQFFDARPVAEISHKPKVINIMRFLTISAKHT